jgi:hypothetical protein
MNTNSKRLALALPLAAAGVAAAIYYRKPLMNAATNLINKSGGLGKAILPAVAAIGTQFAGSKAKGGKLASMLTKGPGAVIAGGLVTYAMSKLRGNKAKA